MGVKLTSDGNKLTEEEAVASIVAILEAVEYKGVMVSAKAHVLLNRAWRRFALGD